MHYLLFYDVVENYAEKRVPYRPEHFALARQFAARGELLLGGAFADPIDGAVLLFKGEGPEVAEAFVNQDPYVKNGLITKWTVRKWNTLAGCLIEEI